MDSVVLDSCRVPEACWPAGTRLFRSTPFQRVQSSRCSAAPDMSCISDSAGGAFPFLSPLHSPSPCTSLRCPCRMLHIASSRPRGNGKRSMDDPHGRGSLTLRMALYTSSRRSTLCDIFPSVVHLHSTLTSASAVSVSSSRGTHPCVAPDFDSGLQANLCVGHVQQ